MVDPQDRERLIEQMARLSAGDLSVLSAALDGRNNATLATVSGSPNDLMWSRFVEAGWMIRSADLPMPLANGFKRTRTFSILPEGWEPLRRVMASLKQQADTKNAEIARIHREVCLPFAETLARQSAQARLTDAERASLLAATVERVVRTTKGAGSNEQRLKAIFVRAGHYLKMQ